MNQVQRVWSQLS